MFVHRRSVKTRGKQAFRKKKKSARAEVKTAARVLDIVKKSNVLAVEKKWISAEVTNSAVNNSWGETGPPTMSIVPRGEGKSERIGRQYEISEIMGHGFVETPGTLNLSSAFVDINVRIVVVLQKETLGVLALADQIFDTPGGSIMPSVAYRNLLFLNKFDIIYDEWLHFPLAEATTNAGSTTTFAVGAVVKRFKFYHKFPQGVQVNMTSAADVITGVTDNNIHIFAIADNTLLLPRMDVRTRLRYRG